MEKNRDDRTKYAMEQEVTEKKDEKKLDWMYKGPNQMVNREEYLLGRPIDKSFEQMAQAEKDAEMNRIPKNHVEHECIPPSLRFFSGNEQVDLARKMQEDPLYIIKKKEMETKSQLLKNPVKLKQLRQLLEQQSKKDKNEKKHKKKKKHKHEIDSSDEKELDMLLAAKYKQLKDKISDKDLIKSMKKVKHKRKKKVKKQSDDSDSESDSSSTDSSTDKDTKKQTNKKKSKSYESIAQEKKYDKDIRIGKSSKFNEKEDRHDKYVMECSSSKDRSNHFNRERTNRAYDRNTDKSEDFRSRSPHYRGNNLHKNRYNGKNYNQERQSSSRSSHSYASHSREDSKETQKWNPKQKVNLTEDEKERRRQEMIANASWRDKEREKNVKQYREEEKKEVISGETYNQDFIRKQLAVAAEIGTVASRIKSNINNIQRSGRAMDTNFAKR